MLTATKQTLILIVLTLCLQGNLFATEDEEKEWEDEAENHALYGASLHFGQSYAAGKSSPGVAYLLGIGGDFLINRGEWDRLELGFELGLGSLRFKEKGNSRSSVTVPVSFYGLAKIGMGYSIGDQLFAIWRLLAGPAWVGYERKLDGITEKSPDTMVSFLGGAEVEVVAPFTTDTDFFGGASFKTMTINIDKLSGSGRTFALDETFQLNIPTLRIGVRKAF